jgi:hypothetical protein
LTLLLTSALAALVTGKDKRLLSGKLLPALEEMRLTRCGEKVGQWWH